MTPFSVSLQGVIDLSNYTGSKGGSGVWQRIISEMPPHATYVEPFLGTGIILRTKRAADASIGVDSNPAVIAWWKENHPEAITICADAISWLKSYKWCAGKLVYADPPYLFETRRCQRNAYAQEFSAEDHAVLLRVLLRLPCHVMLSGYRSALYDTILAAWRRVDIPTVNRAGKRVTECVWCNFPQPTALHDYRFVGRNRRERYWIRCKVHRWLRKLAALPAWERAALFQSINELATAETVSWTGTVELVSVATASTAKAVALDGPQERCRPRVSAKTRSGSGGSASGVRAR